jgi:hypothetical protein
LNICRRMKAPAGCAAWLGQTFNVLENGRFRCPSGALRAACVIGTHRWRQPLVTFA